MSEDEIDDNLDEELFNKIGESMSRAERRRIKKMLKENISEHKHLFKEARKKMKEPGFMENAKGKSAWCMNNIHFKCQGHFTMSKKIPCQCECHNEDSIEKQ